MNEGQERQPGAQEESRFADAVKEIEDMVRVDQEMRKNSIDDEAAWDDTIDLRNTEAMKRIIAAIGWPTISKVGEIVSHSAWLLVQHSDHDPEFQKYCLELMKQAPEGDVNRKNIAYLEDRIRVNTGQGQLYGTQFFETRDENGIATRYEPKPIEDPEHLDERRADMGLEPHAEYAKQLTARYFPHLLKQE